MAERFRFREEVLRAAASRTRRRIVLTLAAAAPLVAIAWAWTWRRGGSGYGTLAFALALLLVLAGLSARKRLGRLHARWATFAIVLGEEELRREVEGFPSARIARAEVEAIEELPQGLVVRGPGEASILVPREVEGWDRIREALSRWAPISRGPSRSPGG